MPSYVLYISPAIAILLVGSVAIFYKKATGSAGRFLQGWMWQVLLSLPAGIWQSLRGWPDADLSGSPAWARLSLPLVGWPFNAGGLTVRFVFEATVGPLEWLVGPRSATVLTNMPYYALLLIIQGSIVAGLFAWRLKKRGTCKDRFVICLGVLFLANSLLNVTWFWAGT